MFLNDKLFLFELLAVCSVKARKMQSIYDKTVHGAAIKFHLFYSMLRKNLNNAQLMKLGSSCTILANKGEDHVQYLKVPSSLTR